MGVHRFGAMLAGLALLMALLPSGPGLARKPFLSGPVPARLIRVVDGDTIQVQAFIWLEQFIRIKIRLDGVDTPEMRGRCPLERDLAKRAQLFTRDFLGGGLLKLSHIRRGKYAGRIIARIRNRKGQDLGQALLAAGLGRPYSGRKRRSWCNTASG